MIERFPELPHWRFSIDEVSAGVYEVVAIDSDGRRVQLKGTDPDALLADAKRSAEMIEGKLV